ncbi:protein lplB [Paenibacillus sp. Root444D2]|nr:protein lplB [Paenibacillus sp. Root444D2]KRE36747.1 protein lplB [Paenibacillus sp. Soil724D2]
MPALLNKIGSNRKLVLVLICLPGMLHFLIFKYVPLFGNIIVFQNYDMFKGITGSKWVGLLQFQKMIEYQDFYRILKNTLIISFYRLVFSFPAPIILALLLNEIRHILFKRTVQTVLYFPHFLSWVIVGGIFYQLLDVHGIFNDLLAWLGMERIIFLQDSQFFRSIVVGSAIWKEVGWGMILYLAAIAGINPNLYEAATVDGANRWKQMWYITLPSLMPTLVVLLLLRVGHLLDTGVEEILIYSNSIVRDVSDVIDVYVYQVGLLQAQFSYTTAIGFFKAVVGLILVLGMNKLAKKLTGESIY